MTWGCFGDRWKKLLVDRIQPALCLPRLGHRVAPPGTVHQPACLSEYAESSELRCPQLCWVLPPVLTPSSPVKVLVSTMRWIRRYRVGAEEGHIPGEGEKHTPLGPKNNSDRHVAAGSSSAITGAVDMTTEKKKDTISDKVTKFLKVRLLCES